jgi:regulator of replication initiation timing
VDDVASGIYKDLDKVKNDLQSQIDALASRVSSLEGRMDAVEARVTSLEKEVEQIKKDIKALDNRVTNLEEEQQKLKARMDAAEAKIAELEDYVKNAIYDVKIEETNDAVIGTINLPFLKVPTMMSYYGLNVSGITKFPTAKSSVHVYNNDGADEAHANGQYASDIDPFLGGVRPIEFEGVGAQLAQYKNNAGTIYFSLNPVGVDITGVTFDIIDSKGNVYPYEISDVKPSDHWLSIATGKTGYGRDEKSETDNVNLYQAKVNLPMDKWYQAISYNLDDTWKVLGKLSGIKDMVAKVKAAKDESGKTEASKVLVKEALQWIQNQYQETYNDKMKMKYQALRATGKVNVAKSPYDLVVAAVEPLSYKTFWELDQNGKNVIKAAVDVEAIEKAVAALIKASGKKVSEIVKIKPTGYQIETINSANVDVATLTQAQIKAIVSNIPYANQVLQKLKQIYYAASSDDIAALQASASSFLSKVSAKIASVAGDNYFYNIVTPIVLYEGAEGIDRLVPGSTLKPNAYKMTVILTSPTEEYLVPAMYKYIAVRFQDQIVDAKILSGQEKVTDLNLRHGECEIIYQTVDYAGFVVTKSYPVYVE